MQHAVWLLNLSCTFVWEIKWLQVCMGNQRLTAYKPACRHKVTVNLKELIAASLQLAGLVIVGGQWMINNDECWRGSTHPESPIPSALRIMMYGWQIEVPHPVIVPVPQPYPVRVPIPKPVAVPVIRELTVPIEKPIPYPVYKKVPYPVEKLVPYPVEKEVSARKQNDVK